MALGVEEMVQRFRILTAGPGFSSGNGQPSVNPVLGNPNPLLVFFGTAHVLHIHTYGQTFTHIKINKS